MSYIDKTEGNDKNGSLSEAVGDTTRLLAVFFVMESQLWKILAGFGLNSKFRIMDNASIDDWLSANAKSLERFSSGQGMVSDSV